MSQSVRPTGDDDRIAAQITATRMQRVDSCAWATPAVREVLAEHAADLRASVPLSVVFDRIRRAVEADRLARPADEASQTMRLVS